MVERSEFQQRPEVYKLGEWFTPFQNYEDVQPSELSDDMATVKNFPFEIEGMGPFVGQALKFLGKAIEEGVILTPTVVIPFTYGELEQYKARLSTPLLDLEVFVRQRLERLFQFDLKLGDDGEIYTCGFGNWWDSSSTGSGFWFKEKEFVGYLHVPEREYILNQVQVRIVPVPDGGGEE